MDDQATAISRGAPPPPAHPQASTVQEDLQEPLGRTATQAFAELSRWISESSRKLLDGVVKDMNTGAVLPGSEPGSTAYWLCALEKVLHLCASAAHPAHFFSFLFFLRFYLFIHERHRERQRHRQREKQAPHGEPNAGLNPRTPGS